jgi:hypothetical protein
MKNLIILLVLSFSSAAFANDVMVELPEDANTFYVNEVELYCLNSSVIDKLKQAKAKANDKIRASSGRLYSELDMSVTAKIIVRYLNDRNSILVTVSIPHSMCIVTQVSK